MNRVMRRLGWLQVLLLVIAPAAASDLPAALDDRLDLEIGNPRHEFSELDFVALRAFYAERGFAPLWVDEQGALPAARALAAFIEAIESHGLRPDDYSGADIAARLEASTLAERAELEYLLSSAVVRLGGDLKSGRVDPAEVDSELHIVPRRSEPAALLAGAGAAVDIVAYMNGLGPQSLSHQRLKEALAKYREIAARGGWDGFPTGETLKPAMTDPRVPLLRRHLEIRGDLEPGSGAAEPLLFDEALVAAVKHFQYRHGLAQDGAVGKNTVAALNVPIEQRIRQIELNMERRRWMKDDLGERYVFVNMADFNLKVVDGPKTIHVARVVVGTPYHRTPVFSGEMTYLVLNPYWNVPPSIARKEILPEIKKDPGYLAKKSIKVFADWSGTGPALDPAGIHWAGLSAGSFPYKLRQEPGEGNALGRVKFMFPNRFNVYLHDTPARSLFSRPVRSFSHGCIRVEHPIELAELLLRDDPAWPRSRIDQVLASGQRSIVQLKRPIPVHLTYLTAWANKDGSIHFRGDVYGRDERLAAALRRASPPVD